MKRWLVLLAVIAVVAGATVAITMVAQAAGARKLTGCMDTVTGELDQVRYGGTPRGGECDGDTEKAVTWNVRGPRGYTGARGPAGPQGEPGIVEFYTVDATPVVTVPPPYDPVWETWPNEEWPNATVNTLVDRGQFKVMCQTGDRAVSGAIYTQYHEVGNESDGSLGEEMGLPVVSGSTPTGWANAAAVNLVSGWGCPGCYWGSASGDEGWHFVPPVVPFTMSLHGTVVCADLTP